MVAAGLASWSDDTGRIKRLIEAKFGTIQAFCEAHGIDEESIERLVSPD